ncbi:MAG: formate dehydrogenase [Proteobacteria bacterium]|nr:formate dehydrogenase [Pseudomonadota bacterium]
MASHRIEPTWKDRLAQVLPFGVGVTKPKHYRDLLRVIWQNRAQPGYAYQVLTRGVCDGCALGSTGLHDWTLKGTHLCMTRLEQLRLNTLPALEGNLLSDISNLKALDNAQLRALGRLPCPLLREGNAPGFKRISWDEAYALMARKLRATTPKRWALSVAAHGITNETYYMAQKAARFLGSNNIDTAARFSHAPSTNAMQHALGVATTTCSFKDWYGTDLVIFFGANPANDQPVTMKYLHEAKRLGTKVVLVNPCLEPAMKRAWLPGNVGSALFGTDIADYWFPVTQGGDIAFLYGVSKILLEKGWVDETFIREHTAEFESLKAACAKLDWATLEKQAGLPWRSMEAFAELVREAKQAVLVWGTGLTRHYYGTDAVRMVLNLGLLKGWVGRDRCGLMPMHGLSGVPGGPEMGAGPTVFPGGKPVNAENALRLTEQYGFPVPDWPGLTSVEMVEAAGWGELDLLYSVGGNFLRTLPGPEHVRAALANIPLRVHQDLILTDEMFIPAKEAVLLLPAKTRYEQDDGGHVTNTERRVAFTPELPRQVGEARAAWKILREATAATFPERAAQLGCETGWQMRAEIARFIPSYDGVQHLNQTGEAFQPGGPHLCADGKFPTTDGKAHFKAVRLPTEPVKSTGETTRTNRQTAAGKRQFLVSTRSGKPFNSVIFAEVDPHNGAPRDAVLMAAEDAAELSLAHGDHVILCNELGTMAASVFVAPMARGNLQVHWPEASHLIPRGIVDPDSSTPDYHTRVTIEKG